MTNPPNLALNNSGAGAPNSGAPISTGDIVVEGDLSGNIVVGHNNQVYSYTVNNHYGDVVNLHVEPVIERQKMKPQPPRPPRDFMDRGIEQEELKKFVNAKDAVFVHGHEGLGKTSLVKQIANSEAAKKLPDGVVYLESVDEAGKALGFDDVLQHLFEAFYHATPPLKASFSNSKTYLNNTVPLVILDGFDFPATTFDKIPDLFPKGALLVAGRTLSTGDDVYKSVQLVPLPRGDAIQLLAGKSGIPLNTTNSPVMARICELCHDVPLAITKLANAIRQKHLDLSDVLSRLERVQPPSDEVVQAGIERSFGVVYSLLSDVESTTLAAIAAVPGISVDRQWLEGVTQEPTAFAELETLELIQANSPRMRLAEGLRQIVQARSLDLQAHRAALLAHLLKELKTRSQDFNFIAEELGNLLGLLEWAVSERRWADVVILGRAIDPYLTLHGLWDAWEGVLNHILQAGQNLRDQAVQAWALHQLGSREIGAGSRGQAIGHLTRALRIREAMNGQVGVAFTQHNLDIALISPPPPANGNFIEKIWKNIQKTFRLPPNAGSIIGLLALVAVVAALIIFVVGRIPHCPKPEGWKIYIAQEGDTFDSIGQRAAISMYKEFDEKALPVIQRVIRTGNCIKDELPQPGETIYVPAIPAPPMATPGPNQEASHPDYWVFTLELSRDPEDTEVLKELGQIINYVYEVTNTSSLPLPGPLAVEDEKGLEIICPEIAKLDPRESISCTSSYRLTQSDLDSGLVTNTAVANIGEIASNQASLTLNIEQLWELRLSKMADLQVYNQVDQEITYTYTILNNGNVTLFPVRFIVTDDHFDTIDCDPNKIELAPSDTATCTATYKINQADIDAGSITNRASASIYGHGIKFMESQVAVETIEHPQSPTLDVTADPKTYETAGQQIEYTVVIKNENEMALPGPLTVLGNNIKGESIIAPLDIPCLNVLSIAPDETVTCTKEYTITQADLDRGSVTSSVKVKVGDISSEQKEISIKANQTPGLTLTKSASPPTYNSVGQAVTYTYVITNNGNVTLGPGQFMVTDDHVDGEKVFPCGSETASLAPRETLTCNKLYSISSADVDTRLVTTKAIASVDVDPALATTKATASEGGVTSPQVTLNISCPYPPSGRVPYLTQPGDTLSKISGWYQSMTEARLMQENCLSSVAIQPDQTLYVPSLPTSSISGIVAYDVNGSNTYDTGDPGAPGVPLDLIDTNTNTVVATTRTSSAGNNIGHYEFGGIKPGEYRISQFSLKISVSPNENKTNVNFIIRPAN